MNHQFLHHAPPYHYKYNWHNERALNIVHRADLLMDLYIRICADLHREQYFLTHEGQAEFHAVGATLLYLIHHHDTVPNPILNSTGIMEFLENRLTAPCEPNDPPSEVNP